MPKSRQVPTVVYIGHFDVPYMHARHYLGATSDPDTRLTLHIQGRSGVPLVAAAVAAGVNIEFNIIAEFNNKDEAYKLEIKLKKQGSRARQCPVCRAEAKRRKRGEE